MSTKPASTSKGFAERESAVGSRRTASQAQRIPVQRIGLRALGYTILLLLAAESLFPLAWMVSASVRERFDVFSGSLIPATITFDAYRFIFNDFHIFNFFGNSLFVSVV